MENTADEISSVSDVSYLLTWLRLAKRKNESEILESTVNRLRKIGILLEEEASEHASFKNLRLEVAKILGSHEL